MFKNILIVASVWHIIVAGIIIFINGNGWCIACRDTLLTGLGVISIIIGIIGIVSGLRNSDPMPGRG